MHICGALRCGYLRGLVGVAVTEGANEWRSKSILWGVHSGGQEVLIVAKAWECEPVGRKLRGAQHIHHIPMSARLNHFTFAVQTHRPSATQARCLGPEEEDE